MEQESTNTPEVPNDDPNTDNHRFSVFRWLQWFPVILIAYILSTGPAAWMEIEFPSMHTAIESIYLPIGALCDDCPPARKALEWYVFGLWRIPLPPH